MKQPLNPHNHNIFKSQDIPTKEEDPTDLELALSSQEPDVMEALEASSLTTPYKN